MHDVRFEQLVQKLYRQNQIEMKLNEFESKILHSFHILGIQLYNSSVFYMRGSNLIFC